MNITLKNNIKNRPTQIKNIKIGLTNKFSLKVTEKLHNDFKKFSGDNSPIHSDFKFCKENNYKKKLGYAFLITSALSKIFGVYFPGGNELCLHQSCNFRNPFFINDTLLFKLKVVQVNIPSKIISIHTEVRSNKKIIFDGHSILKLSLNKK